MPSHVCHERLRKYWIVVFVLFVLLNANMLYAIVYPLAAPEIMERRIFSPEHNQWMKLVGPGERVAICNDNSVSPKLLTDRQAAMSKEPDLNDMFKNMRLIDRMEDREVESLAKRAPGNENCAAALLMSLTPFMNSGIAQFTTKLHFMFPGYKDVFDQMNAGSQYYTDLTKLWAGVYQFPYLYKEFDKKWVDRFGIRLVFSNIELAGYDLEFINKTQEGVFIYRNLTPHAPIRLVDDHGKEYLPTTLHLPDFFNSKNEARSYISIDIEPATQKRLYTTIPFNQHWQLWGDGEPISLLQDEGIFIGAVIPETVHRITLRYINNGRKEGMVLSVVSLLLWLCLWISVLINKNKLRRY